MNEVAPVFLKKYLPADKASVIKEELFVPADMGKITYDELLSNMAEALNLDKTAMIEEWEKLFRVRDEMPPLIRKLRDSADVCLLSNAPLGVIETQFEKHQLSPLFDKIFVSCNLKMAKPDPKIYLHAVSSFGKVYEEIYMIDDNITNLHFLPEIGITPIHFRSVEDIKFLLEDKEV
jgi:HAD superfamily hydrolase (TIGR01509 family)